jgi:hypothetical protein
MISVFLFLIVQSAEFRERDGQGNFHGENKIED